MSLKPSTLCLSSHSKVYQRCSHCQVNTFVFLFHVRLHHRFEAKSGMIGGHHSTYLSKPLFFSFLVYKPTACRCGGPGCGQLYPGTWQAVSSSQHVSIWWFSMALDVANPLVLVVVDTRGLSATAVFLASPWLSGGA